MVGPSAPRNDRQTLTSFKITDRICTGYFHHHDKLPKDNRIKLIAGISDPGAGLGMQKIILEIPF